MFDVQLMGGIVLHEGDVAEMKTGEGKTFVASLRALPERAPRAKASISSRSTTTSRSATPRSGTAPGLRDARDEASRDIENMMTFEASQGGPTKPTSRTERTPSSASTTCATTCRSPSRTSCSAATRMRSSTRSTRSSIDEARTPLIISGEPETAAQIYYDFARIGPRAWRGHASQPGDPKGHGQARGLRLRVRREAQDRRSDPAPRSRKIERALRVENLYDPRNGQLVDHFIQALKAQSLFRLDVEYVIQDGGEDRRRVHRPDHGRAPLERRAPPGDRGEGGREDPGGAPDPRHDHSPELLPPLREARRDDRYREDRGEGVRRDLQPRTSSRSRRTSTSRAGQERPRLQDEEGSSRRSSATSRSAPKGPARPRRHDRRRDVRVPLRSC